MEGFEFFSNNGSMKIFSYYVKHYQGLRTGFVAQISGQREVLTMLLEAFPLLQLLICKVNNSIFGGRIVDICTSCKFLNKICENTCGNNLMEKQCHLLCLHDKEIKCSGKAQILWGKKNQDYKKGIQRWLQLLAAN